jgi:hypothetical protein
MRPVRSCLLVCGAAVVAALVPRLTLGFAPSVLVSDVSWYRHTGNRTCYFAVCCVPWLAGGLTGVVTTAVYAGIGGKWWVGPIKSSKSSSST